MTIWNWLQRTFDTTNIFHFPAGFVVSGVYRTSTIHVPIYHTMCTTQALWLFRIIGNILATCWPHVGDMATWRWVSRWRCACSTELRMIKDGCGWRQRSRWCRQLSLSLCMAGHGCTHQSCCLHVCGFFLSDLCLIVYLSVWLPACVCLSARLPACISSCLYVFLPVCLSVWLSTCLTFCLSLCLSVRLCVFVRLTD